VKGADVRFRCGHCDVSVLQATAEVKGKLGWKLDCAARWNLYRIDLETFANGHLEEFGTFDVARFVARSVFRGRVPAIFGYGHVRITREVSGHLLGILPPEVLKKLFLSHPTRDLHLNRDSVMAFCGKCEVEGGRNYLEWVRRELPQAALRWSGWRTSERAPGAAAREQLLVHHGNLFSRFYFGKEYGLHAPDPLALESSDLATLDASRRILAYAISVREGDPLERRNAPALIRSYLHAQGDSPRLYQFLRRLFGQPEGPSISTLLVLLPPDYLGTVQLLCSQAMTASAHRAASLQSFRTSQRWSPPEGEADTEGMADGTYGLGPSGPRPAQGGK
jgi:hypothetical protein